MYEIRPESISTFIEDNSIKLPRFQRKQTWDDKRNFELCISVFKEFPMGVCILNKEKDAADRVTKWLLDGRQRRNALIKMWEDPENIYQWAKKWVGFKTNDQLADLADSFREKIREYLEDDDDDEQDESGLGELSNDATGLTETEVVASDNGANEITVDLTKAGLEFLLEIIQLIHNKTAKHSGFTRPFDFSKHISNLPYQETVQGRATLSCKKLKTFISEYQQWCKNESKDFDESTSFEAFLRSRFSLDSTKQAKVNQQVTDNWRDIKARIDLLDKLHEVLHRSKIGLIELTDIRSTDSQKIFNIINSKGTKLNAVEILSAKPSWNKPIRNANTIQIEVKDQLYARIGIKNDSLVKWDLPATLLPRMNDAPLLFDFGGDNPSGLEKQLTLGFKLLSGIFQSGVRKENIDELGMNVDVDWERDFEDLLQNLNLFTKVIFDSEFFRFFKSWRKSLMSITSDAAALNFFLVLYQDWKRKGSPIVSSTEVRAVQKNAFILLDQTIFDYVTRQWWGASDAKIANNLSQVHNSENLFTELATEKWIELLDEIFESNAVGGVKITQRVMEPILYHYYAVNKIAGPNGNDVVEVDHIIPQSLFDSSSYSKDEGLRHNLFNLALLPKRDNASKSNKTLAQVSDAWLKHQIVTYSSINAEDFLKYSNISNLDQLKKFRRPIFERTFSDLRADILNN